MRLPQHALRHLVDDDEAHPGSRHAIDVAAVDFIAIAKALALLATEEAAVLLEVHVETAAKGFEAHGARGSRSGFLAADS